MIQIYTFTHPSGRPLFIGIDTYGTVHWSWDGQSWNFACNPY
jgi:hypothetical protein